MTVKEKVDYIREMKAKSICRNMDNDFLDKLEDSYNSDIYDGMSIEDKIDILSHFLVLYVGEYPSVTKKLAKLILCDRFKD